MGKVGALANQPDNQPHTIMNLTSSEMTKIAVALGICFAAYKFGPAAVKAAALGVAGTIVAKQLPYVSDALA